MGWKYRGKKKKWFFVKFLRSENEIKINTKNAEFIEWKWVEMEKLPDLIVPFKKKIYEKILSELKKIN